VSSPNIDNRVISIIDCGEYNDFLAAMFFFFRDHGSVCQYTVSKEYGLILFWTTVDSGVVKDGDDQVEVISLPYAMGLEAAAQFVWHWLQAVDYPPQPDHDGSNKKAWHIYNQAWGHVAGRFEASVAIKPIWGMVGK
jgi:hypothetical protein